MSNDEKHQYDAHELEVARPRPLLGCHGRISNSWTSDSGRLPFYAKHVSLVQPMWRGRMTGRQVRRKQLQTSPRSRHSRTPRVGVRGNRLHGSRQGRNPRTPELGPHRTASTRPMRPESADIINSIARQTAASEVGVGKGGVGCQTVGEGCQNQCGHKADDARS